MSYKYKVSIILPGIRPHNWLKFYNSVVDSCNKHSWEIIFVSPFDMPDNMSSKDNIKYLKDFGCPTRCVQRATTVAEGELYALGADDGYYLNNAFSESIDLYDQVASKKDIIIQKYMEGPDMKGDVLPKERYMVRKSEAASVYLPAHYMFAMNPLVNMNYFREIGGYDCCFEFTSFAAHDFSYRVQRDGGNLFLSNSEVLTVDYMPDVTGDHAPVHYAYYHDMPLCRQMYQDPNVVNRIKIDFDNWKSSPEVWVRRWPNGVLK